MKLLRYLEYIFKNFPKHETRLECKASEKNSKNYPTARDIILQVLGNIVEVNQSIIIISKEDLQKKILKILQELGPSVSVLK